MSTSDPTYFSFQKVKLKGQFFRLTRHLPVANKIKQNKYGNNAILDTESGRKVLKQAIQAGKPFMAARFGTTEGASFVKYWEIKLKYGDKPELYPQSQVDNICLYSGFFPSSKTAVRRGCFAFSVSSYAVKIPPGPAPMIITS